LYSESQNIEQRITMEYTYILTGGLVGLVIGLTGVGGGSLMTPILIIGFGINPVIAVGTDLLYAAITKCSGVFFHHKKQNINWSIVKLLALGSIPASLLTHLIINYYDVSTESYNTLITRILSVMLMLTAFVILYKNRITNKIKGKMSVNKQPIVSRQALTIVSGIFLGIVVTISSVGAGALGTAILFLLYPKTPAIKIIGTDLAHAVPLTAVAGLGHLSQQHVSIPLLLGLLAGGIPMVYLGARLGKRLSDQMLRAIIATMLFSLGLKLALY
jgi:uncharacterized membrane protein YfcA